MLVKLCKRLQNFMISLYSIYYFVASFHGCCYFMVLVLFLKNLHLFGLPNNFAICTTFLMSVSAGPVVLLFVTRRRVSRESVNGEAGQR